MNRKLLLHVLVIIFLALITGRSSFAKGKVPGQYIIKLAQSAPSDKIITNISLSAENVHLKKLSRMSQNASPGLNIMEDYYLFSSSDSTTTIADIETVIGSQNIEIIEPNYYLEMFEFPQDSLFDYQWYLHNIGQMYYGIDRIEGDNNDQLVMKSGTAGADIGLTDYYTNTPAEKTKIVVAIIDSGVDVTHPELQGQFWKNIDEIPLNGIDDDHNGYIDDTLGFDISGDNFAFFNQVGDNDPTDHVGHGSHIAGIIAAKNDSVGVVGVAPNSLIMPLKVFPNFTIAVAVEGIIYAVDNGADIISLSWGTPFESAILKDALSYARANNVFVCIAPGNTGNTDVFFPAGFDSTFVVAASNSDGYLTYFTTFGPHIDIVAPGEDILSIRGAGTDLYAPSPSNEPFVRIIGDDSLYYLSDGTSMSTPVVAGAAALIWSIKPELSVSQLEEILINGAVDIVDPFNQGDSLVGYDTLSGYGLLNIDNSLSLLEPEGLSFSSPEKKERYTTDIPIKVNRTGGYNDEWMLYYAVGQDTSWMLLANGSTIPNDSLLFTIDSTFVNGHIYLKLIDILGNQIITDFYNIRQRKLQLISPSNNDIANFDILISGDVYGPDFDSLLIIYTQNGTQGTILSDTKEYYGSFIYDWKISGVDTGDYKMYLYGFYQSDTLIDSAAFRILSVFAQGWPQSIGTNTSLSPFIADLNHDNLKEIYIPSGNGLFGFNAHGELLDGFPALAGIDVRCMPAVYDITHDGFDEIIITSDTGIYVIKYDGTIAEGWPQYCKTGMIPFGHGFPNPTVTKLGAGEDSAIVIINTSGEILAYKFNGDSYFYSLEGYYAVLNPRLADFFAKGGQSSPFVSSVDFNNDGLFEVVSSYTAPEPYAGVGLFNGRTGLPLLSETDPVIILESDVYGTALADFDNDNRPEIISLGSDTSNITTLWVKTNMTEDYPGWPVTLDELFGWFISPITLADLDLDGVPEIMFTAFWFDIAHLFIFNSDGTPYQQQSNAPYGAAYTVFGTLGIPVAANLYGDEFPEIIFRSGFILPGSGPEELHILDNKLNPIPGWPSETPALHRQVFSTQFAPLIDDLDSDGLVELILLSDNSDILVWDFDASSNNGRNKVRYLVDNLNSNKFISNDIATDIHDTQNNLPKLFTLDQNYPNPFNPTTTISFELPKKDEIKLTVFNILGQEVQNLAEGIYDAGLHTVLFNGEQYASGIYLYRLEVADNSFTKKMVLLK